MAGRAVNMSRATVKPPSNYRHDGFTVTPSPALYVKAGMVTVAGIGGNEHLKKQPVSRPG
jgi:hypothetical protein